MKTFVKNTFTGLCAATLLTACTLDPALLAGVTGSSAFQTLDSATAPSALDTHTQPGRPADRGPGGPHQKGKPGAGPDMFADLNLTDAQKTALEALKAEMKPPTDQKPDESKMKAFKAAVDAAFVSDSFDINTLQSQLGDAPNHDAMLTAQAEHMIKVSQILTAEQKATLQQKQNQREANMPEFKGPHQGGKEGKSPLEHLTQTLKLSDNQVSTLKSAFEVNKPDVEALKAQRQVTQTAIDAELANASPSVDKIVALLKADRPEASPPNPLNHLAQLHAVLTSEQRQAFVNAGLSAGPGGSGPHNGGHPGMLPQGGGFKPF